MYFESIIFFTESIIFEGVRSFPCAHFVNNLPW